MPRLLIVSDESNAEICLPNRLLPTFYMEDYTLLGLKVGDLDATVQLLEKNGVGIYKNLEYAELSLDNKDQIPHIIQLLNDTGIPCVFSDMVEQIYQG